MSRPLIPNKARESEARAWHNAVFKAHGKKCWHCGGEATDAAHIIPRSRLGPKLRYAIPVENGRPACRRCHELQESRIIEFPLSVVRAAIRAHNKIAKVKMQEP